MAENLTTYTEIDPSGYLSTSSTTCTITSMPRNEDTYLYKDFGAGHFANYFECKFQVTVTGDVNSGNHYVTFANLIDDQKGIETSGGDSVSVVFYKSNTYQATRLTEVHAGTRYNSSAAYDTGEALGTAWYCTIVKDDSVGTYGTAYLYVYTDSARTNLVNTQTIEFHSVKSFRYFYPVQSYNSNHTNGHTGSIQDVTLTLGTKIPVPKATFNFTPKVPGVYNSGNDKTIAIPKVNFNFTGKVPTVSVVSNVTIAVPSKTFNFTRFAPTIRTQDKGIAVPKVNFNFTGQAPTIGLTEHRLVAVPKVTFNFTGKVPSVLLTNTEEEISWGIFDTSGNAITGATVTIKIRNRETGHILDWSDNTFKLGGGASPAANMTELDAANFQGYYGKVITIGGWADGWYIAATNYAGAPKQNGSIEFLVKGGLMVDSYNSANLDVAVSSRPTIAEIEGSTVLAKEATVAARPTLSAMEASGVLAKQAKIDFIEKWILNKLVESADGTTITLYDDNGTTILKQWPYSATTKTRSKAT